MCEFGGGEIVVGGRHVGKAARHGVEVRIFDILPYKHTVHLHIMFEDSYMSLCVVS